MNYYIALANLGQDISPLGSTPEWEWRDETEFVNRCGFGRLAYNMENLWAWNIPELTGIPADGPCVFIKWKSP